MKKFCNRSLTVTMLGTFFLRPLSGHIPLELGKVICMLDRCKLTLDG